MTKAVKQYDILLIEPDVVLANSFTKALALADFSVQHVPSAQAAITALDASKPKLIILELQLRSHNGIEFLHELRSYPDLQDISVVVLTFVPEYASGLTKKQQVKLNICMYLYKPRTSLKKLTEVAAEVLSE